jgi:hypothetical protein
MVSIKQIMRLLPSEVIKGKKAIINKLLVALIYANQNICIQQACEQTKVYSHSKNILNQFKNFNLKEIKDFFFHTSLAILKLSIKQLNLRYLKLAVDITEEPYYGKLDNPYIWNRSPKSPNGATGHFKYLTISATNFNCKLILFNMMLGPGYNVEDIIPEALNEIRKLIPIKQITFDRGFDNHKLIYELEKLKLNYIIFSRKNKSTKKIFENIENGDSYSKLRTLKFYKNQEKHTCNARYVYIKSFQFDKTEEFYDWIFITNIKSFTSIRHIIASYRNRWGIETIFRILKQDFRIKTTSKHQSVRLMCWFFAMFFYNIWQIAKYFISNTIKAKSLFETIRFGFKIKYNIKYHYEKEILKFFNLD